MSATMLVDFSAAALLATNWPAMHKIVMISVTLWLVHVWCTTTQCKQSLAYTCAAGAQWSGLQLISFEGYDLIMPLQSVDLCNEKEAEKKVRANPE